MKKFYALFWVISTLAIIPCFEASKLYSRPENPEYSGSQTIDRNDYVIIVGSTDLVNAVDTLKTWKEEIGYNVAVVTTSDIYNQYSGDNAERIWNFLHDRYDREVWGIQYVLLVGDIDRIPMRILYPDGNATSGGGYATDYYYAQLEEQTWDVDGDNRWGEFNHDRFDTTYDVIVGRLPFNDSRTVRDICINIIDFEQDTDSWKRKALLAHGVMDYRSTSFKNDCAVLAEYLIENIFKPKGWTTTTLYEGNGIFPSDYTPTIQLSQTNFENQCSLKGQSIVNCVSHGNIGDMGSFVWTGDFDRDGQWDPHPEQGTAEIATTRFTRRPNIQSHPVSAVVFLCGCMTGPLFGNDPNLSSSPLLSRYLCTTTRTGMMLKDYLQYGAVGVIAAATGADYSHNWTGPNNDNWNTLNYYFYDYLINKNMRVGDAFYAAQLQYARKIRLQRGIRTFNFFGDPSLALKGIDYKPGGTDVLIHEQAYYAFAADNADNGDMYVAVSTTAPSDNNGLIIIYKSSQHGEYWSTWCALYCDFGVAAMDILVGEHNGYGQTDSRVHVFVGTNHGAILDYRIDMNDPMNHSLVSIASAGRRDIPQISVARDPGAMPSAFNIYLAWEESSLHGDTVRVVRSVDNGTIWTDFQLFQDYEYPTIDAGPGGKVHLIARAGSTPFDIHAKRSTDSGVNWSNWTNITSGDNAGSHKYAVVAASTDAAAPTVWAVYTWTNQSVTKIEYDLRYAFSTDAGANWTTNQILSSDKGIFEIHPDIAGYRTGPNRWVNLAYNRMPYPTGGENSKAVWCWDSGTLPGSWSAERIINDFYMDAWYKPCIVYSPGAPRTGSGVVYGGYYHGNIYFSAPWLPANPSNAASEPLSAALASNSNQPFAVSEVPVKSAENHPLNTNSFKFAGENELLRVNETPPLIWRETADIEGAFAVSALIQSEELLYAAAVTEGNEFENHGTIFRSEDGGESWERMGELDMCWSVSCLYQSREGVLFAGGMMHEGDAFLGAIYRSEDGGSWYPVLTFPDGVVFDICQTNNGHFFAATGWNGLIFRSVDNGTEWHVTAELGETADVYAVKQAPNGVLYAGAKLPDGSGQILFSENGEEWILSEGLEGMRAVYDLLEMEDRLYAAARDDDMGWILECGMEIPPQWQRTTELPDTDVRAVHSLARGPEGEIFAGVEMMRGSSFTKLYLKQPDQQNWREFGGMIDLANAVSSIVTNPEMVYIATGYVYGNVYKCSFEAGTAVMPENSANTPAYSSLSQNYPNPFNPSTRIDFQIADNASAVHTTLKIYDVLGREIVTLIEEFRQPGSYSVTWNGQDDSGKQLATGAYLCRLKAGDMIQTKRIMLLK
ncbi:T9SS type A sorting domain-containing protein [candidate division KSB1 bacterium]|nr:T9SS type A sorting domain-containing protein [candidate division KSB1 bacterium]